MDTEPDIEPEGVVTEPEAEDEPAAGGVVEGPLDEELLLLEGGVEAGGVLDEDDELLEGGVAELDGDFLPSSRPHAASANAAATAMRSALLMGVPLNGLMGAAILEDGYDTEIGV